MCIFALNFYDEDEQSFEILIGAKRTRVFYTYRFFYRERSRIFFMILLLNYFCGSIHYKGEFESLSFFFFLRCGYRAIGTPIYDK